MMHLTGATMARRQGMSHVSHHMFHARRRSVPLGNVFHHRFAQDLHSDKGNRLFHSSGHSHVDNKQQASTEEGRKDTETPENQSQMQKMKKGMHFFLDQCKVLYRQTGQFWRLKRETSSWNNSRTREANYRDIMFMRTARADLTKLLPFTLISILPFSTVLIPIILYFFPRFLPSVFYTEHLKEKLRRLNNEVRDPAVDALTWYFTEEVEDKYATVTVTESDQQGEYDDETTLRLKMIAEYLGIMKDLFSKYAVTENAEEHMNSAGKEHPEASEKMELHEYVDMCVDVLHELTRAVTLLKAPQTTRDKSNMQETSANEHSDASETEEAESIEQKNARQAAVKEFRSMFTLHSIPSDQEAALSQFSTLKTRRTAFGRKSVLVWQIARQRKDDKLIDKFGVDNMSLDELRDALHRRGFRFMPTDREKFSHRFLKDEQDTEKTLIELRRLMSVWIDFSKATYKQFTFDTCIPVLPGIITWKRSADIYNGDDSSRPVWKSKQKHNATHYEIIYQSSNPPLQSITEITTERNSMNTTQNMSILKKLSDVVNTIELKLFDISQASTYGVSDQKGNMEQMRLFVDKVLEVDQEMKTGGSRATESGFQLVKKRNQMVDVGQRIWNMCVKRKKAQPKQIVKNFFAQLSQCSCDLLMRGWAEDTVTRNCELLKCFCATAKAWSDADTQESLTKARTCFTHAGSLADKVMNSVNNSEVESEGEQFRVKKTVLSFYVLQTEVVDIPFWKFGLPDQALHCSNTAKALLDVLQSEAQRLAILMYNIAVDLHQKKDFEAASKWLTASFEAYEKDVNKDKKKQARTLRLLASAYMEMNNDESAMTCVAMANKHHSCAAGLFLQSKILLWKQREHEAQESVMELINAPDAAFHLSLNACLRAADYKCHTCAKFGFRALMQKYPSETEARLRYFELLVSPSLQDFATARELIDNLTQEYMRDISSVDKTMLRKFHILLWNLGVERFKEKDFFQSIEWFRMAFRLVAPDDNVNRAKTLRFLGRCHLHLNQLDEAHTAARDAEALDPKSLYTHYLLFVICAKMNDDENAIRYLDKLRDDEDFKPQFYVLAAQDVRDKKPYVAAKSLEKFLEQSKNIPTPEQGYILRSLVHLTHELDHDIESNRRLFTGYMRVFIEKLRVVGKMYLFENQHDNEIEWFHAVCWNKGIEFSKKKYQREAYELLEYAGELYKHQLETIPNLDTQRMCILFRIYTLIELAEEAMVKPNVSMDAITDHVFVDLKTALVLIDECRKICRKVNAMKAQKVNQNQGNDSLGKLKKLSNTHDSVTPVLDTCEFRCKILLGSGEAELVSIIERSENNKVLETIASMAMQARQIQVEVCQRALKKCILKLQSVPLEQHDIPKIVTLYRQVIQIARTRDDAVEYVEQFQQMLLSTYGKDMTYINLLPQNEIKWIVTDSYNNGIYYYKLSRFTKSEKWLGIAIALCEYIIDEDSSVHSEDSIVSIVRKSYETILSKMTDDNRVDAL